MRIARIASCFTLSVVAMFGSAYSNQVRLKNTFLSHDGSYRLSLSTRPDCDTGHRWEMIETSTGKTLYDVCYSLAHLTVVIGPKGTTFFAIDDYLPLGFDPAPQMPVTHFFKAGVLTRQHTLVELIGESLCGSYSASHFDWLVGEPKVGNQGVTVQLTTRNLYRHTLSLASGEVLRSNPIPIIQPPAELFFGVVRKLHRNTWNLEVSCWS